MFEREKECDDVKKTKTEGTQKYALRIPRPAAYNQELSSVYHSIRREKHHVLRFFLWIQQLQSRENVTLNSAHYFAVMCCVVRLRPRYVTLL
jgi:hypothetical protein